MLAVPPPRVPLVPAQLLSQAAPKNRASIGSYETANGFGYQGAFHAVCGQGGQPATATRRLGAPLLVGLKGDQTKRKRLSFAQRPASNEHNHQLARTINKQTKHKATNGHEIWKGKWTANGMGRKWQSDGEGMERKWREKKDNKKIIKRHKKT